MAMPEPAHRHRPLPSPQGYGLGSSAFLGLGTSVGAAANDMQYVSGAVHEAGAACTEEQRGSSAGKQLRTGLLLTLQAAASDDCKSLAQDYL